MACHECRMKSLPKASELPLYDSDDYKYEFSEISVPLVSNISALRKQIFQYTSYVTAFQDKTAHVYNTGIAHSKSALERLKDEDNQLQRALIIASGGLFGLFLARKGGVLKKVVYISLGTGGVFSGFYPDVSKEKASVGWNLMKGQVKSLGLDLDKISEEVDSKLENLKLSSKIKDISMKLPKDISMKLPMLGKKEDESPKTD